MPVLSDEELQTLLDECESISQEIKINTLKSTNNVVDEAHSSRSNSLSSLSNGCERDTDESESENLTNSKRRKSYHFIEEDSSYDEYCSIIDDSTQEENDSVHSEVEESSNLIEESSLDSENLLSMISQRGPLLAMSEFKAIGYSPSSILDCLNVSHDIEQLDLEKQWELVIQFLVKHFFQRDCSLKLESSEDVVSLIEKSKNILVVTGAGVSTSCGVPDFRSENGIYSQVEDAESIFDIEYFRQDPVPFYSLCKKVFPETFECSSSHNFIRLLEDNGKLLRNYTQNIDNLEHVAGITKLFQCHGSFGTFTCMECFDKVESSKVCIQDQVPFCSCGGVYKPDIVFFGEPLPKDFNKHLESDIQKVDLVLVMGSSLQVYPVAGILHVLPPNVPRILINNEELKHEFDLSLIGDCDLVSNYLSGQLGWTAPIQIEESRETGKVRITKVIDEILKEIDETILDLEVRS